MRAEFKRVLINHFRSMSPEEILQEIRIAEFLAEGRCEQYVFGVARRRLHTIERARLLWMRRITLTFDAFPGGFEENADDMLPPCRNQRDDMADEMDWQVFVERLPLRARMLATFAKEEAEMFDASVDGGMWSKNNLSVLRRRVHDRYVAWDRRHCERAYREARHLLVVALRRHTNGKGACTVHK